MKNSEFKKELEQRSKRFAVELINFLYELPYNKVLSVLINQLTKSGTSVGANLGPWNNIMHYVYILISDKDQQFYTGCTHDLKKWLSEHNKGAVPSTKNRTPFKLVYYEACLDKRDAYHRERYLKTTYGKRYIKNRLKNYFTG